MSCATSAPRSRSVEPVIQIFAEGASRNLGSQVTVAGRDQAHVSAHSPIRADRLEAPVLQHPQQLRLGLQAQLADFVEEDGAARRSIESSGALAVGPGEGASLMPEQLGLEEGLGDGGAVDRHQGSAAAAASGVDCPCAELLARPGLPGEEHGQV
jgi:hypothetical protein